MLSCVWLLANSWTIAEQVPLSMGFFWQEYWSVFLVIQLYLTLWDPIDSSPPGSSVHGNSLGKNPGVGCYVLLQGILPTQGSNPGLQHCRQILQHPSHQESPKILERVTCLFQGIFLTQELNQGLLHCRQIFFFFFFTRWVTRGSQEYWRGVFLLQGIFLTHGSKPRLLHFLHWQADSLPLVPPGKPLSLGCPLSEELDTWVCRQIVHS